MTFLGRVAQLAAVGALLTLTLLWAHDVTGGTLAWLRYGCAVLALGAATVGTARLLRHGPTDAGTGASIWLSNVFLLAALLLAVAGSGHPVGLRIAAGIQLVTVLLGGDDARRARDAAMRGLLAARGWTARLVTSRRAVRLTVAVD